MANIRLNILPVGDKTFSFKVYRKLKQQNDTKEDEIYLYNLPQGETLNDYKPYWISFTPKDGFEEYIAGEGVCLIEWANLIEEILPEERTEILIEKDLEQGFDFRRITVTERK